MMMTMMIILVMLIAMMLVASGLTGWLVACLGGGDRGGSDTCVCVCVVGVCVGGELCGWLPRRCGAGLVFNRALNFKKNFSASPTYEAWN